MSDQHNGRVERCLEDLELGTSSHDWPITNLGTGQVSGLCWYCGCSAEEFYGRVKKHLGITHRKAEEMNDHIIEVTRENERRLIGRRASDVSTREKAQRYDALVEQLKWSAHYHKERWEKAKALVAANPTSHSLSTYLQELATSDAVMHENFNHLHVYVDPAIECPCPHCERSRQHATTICERTGGLL